MTETEIKDCCIQVEKPVERSGLLWGILYGILPHTFCILFVLLSVIGATAGSTFIRKFLFIPHLFLYMIALSLIFASLSAIIYLKRNGSLSLSGVKSKWKYLTILFSTTLAINLLFVYVIIPKTADLGSTNNTVTAQTTDSNNVPQNAQVIHMDQLAGGYSPNSFTVKAGVPVHWVINSKKDTCAASIYSPKLGIRVELNPGKNVIDFTPSEPGIYKFTCIMGMYSGTIIVEK